jgi:predicted ArsR family transcriptional regulator
MPDLQWNQRFFASTRGHIILLLRRDSRTVDALAQILNLTDNAVRAHLATLERDGFVRQSGERRGSGKPAFMYELSQGAEQLFPKAYGPVLRELLGVLSDGMSTNEVETLMRRTGRRLATQQHLPTGDLQSRLKVAIDVLNELGGLAELKEENGTYIIQGYSCPLATVVPGHPEVCRLAETLVSELVGLPVQECCDNNESARCRFSVSKS